MKRRTSRAVRIVCFLSVGVFFGEMKARAIVCHVSKLALLTLQEVASWYTYGCVFLFAREYASI